MRFRKQYSKLRNFILDRGTSRVREDAISEYWRVAAVHVIPPDSEFVDIFERKVYYWLSPEQYSREDVLGHDMSLLIVLPTWE